jgi:AhpD family alkylhydroperoxidase
MKATKRLAVIALTLGAFSALADQKADATAALDNIQKTLGFVPEFLRQLPEAALPGTCDEMKSLQMSTDTAIPRRYKELIGLGVAAQIPCTQCVIAHTEFARQYGARPDELGVAIAQAALTRHWSTYLRGTQIDEELYQAELTEILDRKKNRDPEAPPPPGPINVFDAQTAYDDAQQLFGIVPDFLRSFPTNSVAGAWKTLRDVEMNDDGPVPPKYVHLIGLAVAAQIPCNLGIVTRTELARANGASDAEIKEAVAVGAFTRHLATLLSGLQINELKFKADIARLTRPKKVATR